MDGGYGRPIDDAERQAVIASLQRRAARGQLDEDELTARVSRARTAMTRAGLDGLLMDLPPDPEGDSDSRAAAARAPRPWAGIGADATPTSTRLSPPRGSLPPPPTRSDPVATSSTSSTSPRDSRPPPPAGAATSPTPPPAVGAPASRPTVGGFPSPPGSIDRVAAGAEMMSVSHLAPMLVALVVVAVVGVAVVLAAGRGDSDPERAGIAVDDQTRATATTAIGPVVADDPGPIPTIPAPTTTALAPDQPPPAPDPTVAPPPIGGDERLAVGVDIAPGRFMQPPGASCFWEIHDDAGEAVSFGMSDRAVIDVQAGDAAVIQQFCAPWEPYTAPPQPAASVGNGDWLVGADLAAGTYRPSSPLSQNGIGCFWERATGFRHGYDEIVEWSDFGRDVTLRDGERFTSDGCGTWTKV